MSEPSLTILLNNDPSSELVEEIDSIVPHARILRRENLEAEPTLIQQIEVIYGHPSREQIRQADGLRWVQVTSAGADWSRHADIVAHPFVLTNARIHATPISEHLFGMLLMLTRGLHLAYQNQLQRKWDGAPSRNVVEELPGKMLCIVGLGVIGQRCAKLGEAHEMSVIGVRRHPQLTPHVQQVYGIDGLQEALSRADMVMVILPNAVGTRKLIDHEAFAAMKQGAHFLNAGRGQTVDTDALVEALRCGKLRGAGLDVVDPEPLPADHPLWSMSNVILTPHYSGSHPDYDAHAAQVFLDNLRRYVAEEPLRFVVDKERGY